MGTLRPCEGEQEEGLFEKLDELMMEGSQELRESEGKRECMWERHRHTQRVEEVEKHTE